MVYQFRLKMKTWHMSGQQMPEWLLLLSQSWPRAIIMDMDIFKQAVRIVSELLEEYTLTELRQFTFDRMVDEEYQRLYYDKYVNTRECPSCCEGGKNE